MCLLGTRRALTQVQAPDKELHSLEDPRLSVSLLVDVADYEPRGCHVSNRCHCPCSTRAASLGWLAYEARARGGQRYKSVSARNELLGCIHLGRHAYAVEWLSTVTTATSYALDFGASKGYAPYLVPSSGQGSARRDFSSVLFHPTQYRT